MKLFVCYRRDDTGGRAGRLVDALVARFGARNVFQDVDAMALGHDFRTQVEVAIATSDAVLIVIGRQWLGVDDATGGRRIDRDDDFVRLEVAMALSSGIPVVPVLVDGATLPADDELPDDVSPMLRRPALSVRDSSWHQDVDNVIRRLKGEHRPAKAARRWMIPTAIGLSMLVVALVAAAVVRSRGEGSSDELASCGPPDATWVPVELAAEPVGTIVVEAKEVEVEVREARLGGIGGRQVIVELAVRNITGDRPGDDSDLYDFYRAEVDGLLVDGVATEPSCFGPVTGEQTLEPGERVIAWVGFATAGVPSGAELVLEMNPDGTIDVGRSP